MSPHPNVRIAVVLLLTALGSPALSAVHIPLVQHHLLVNHLRIAVFLSCDRLTQLQSVRLAHRLGVWSGTADIRRHSGAVDLLPLFRHHNHRVGVVLDLQCPVQPVAELLAAVSQRVFFHRRYVWLMFARDWQQIGEQLAGENVNVDAEITAVTAEGKEGDDWSLWDVWNPSFSRGGRLNVTRLQRWSATTVPRVPVGQLSKYERRRDFGGLVLKGVLVVGLVSLRTVV